MPDHKQLETNYWPLVQARYTFIVHFQIGIVILVIVDISDLFLYYYLTTLWLWFTCNIMYIVKKRTYLECSLFEEIILI